MQLSTGSQVRTGRWGRSGRQLLQPLRSFTGVGHRCAPVVGSGCHRCFWDRRACTHCLRRRRSTKVASPLRFATIAVASTYADLLAIRPGHRALGRRGQLWLAKRGAESGTRPADRPAITVSATRASINTASMPLVTQPRVIEVAQRVIRFDRWAPSTDGCTHRLHILSE